MLLIETRKSWSIVLILGILLINLVSAITIEEACKICETNKAQELYSPLSDGFFIFFIIILNTILLVAIIIVIKKIVELDKKNEDL